MLELKKGSITYRNAIEGNGLINNIIDKIPIELHIPGYQYCGPGTNLKKRLLRGKSFGCCM